MARRISVEITGDAASLERAFGRAQLSANKFNSEVGKSVRGTLAGTGAFRGLGRSIAFASGGFLAFASAGELLRKSIDAATEDAAAQRQLAAQFKANKQSLSDYNRTIENHTLLVSRLSGFTGTDLTNAFILAYRASKDVTVGLKIQSVAANVARGRHIGLQQSTIALTKAYLGQSTALRRLGIMVPTTLHGLAALGFVQSRFAGQAQSGTTAQDRFAAAIHNTEVSIGKALLPTLTKYLDSATKWLDNTQHQQEIQQKVNEGVKKGAGFVHGLGNVYKAVATPLGLLIKGTDKLGNAIDYVANAAKRAGRNVGKYLFTPGPAGQGVSDRVPGMSPRGPGHFAPPSTIAPSGTAGKLRASLDYRISLENQKLAKDQAVGSTAAQRADLVRLKALTEEKITKTKDLAKRTQLYQTLGSITQQIAAIDSKAAADRKTAADKALAEKRKDAAAAAKQAQQIKQAEAKLRSVMATVHQAFTSALDSARSQIGDLFSGPLLNPSTAQTKAILGVPGPTIGRLTSDVLAQTAQSKRFNSDLRRLRKQALAGGLSKGGTNELIKELRAQGVAAIPQIEALTNANPAQRARFLKAFAQREAFAHRVAQMTVQARTVHISTSKVPIEVTVNLDGKTITKVVTTHQQRNRHKQGAQRGGRNAGHSPMSP